VRPDGELRHDGGRLRLTGPGGELRADGIDPAGYAEVVGEAVEPGSFLRLPDYRPLGYPAGLYRVELLARLNCATRCGTPRAERVHARFRGLGNGAVLQSFHAHLARLVEILFAVERIGELLDDPALLEREVLALPGAGADEAVGACEAPRGTLLHHYRVDADGLVRWAHLLVASGRNALALNRTVRQIADRWLSGAVITHGLLNRAEAGIRAYDPCLSCATHAEGGRVVSLRLPGQVGALIDEALTRVRDSRSPAVPRIAPRFR
jgi:NAD-reducing hydrogenase large subunit